MDQYIDWEGGFADSLEDSGESNVHQAQHLPPSSSAPAQDQSNAAFYHPSASQHISCEIKPRLTKEQHDILESHYQKQNKPNTNTKKGFAESLNVSLDKVNNWFQNRRAKSKQDAKKAAGALNLYNSQNFGSDSEASPYQTSPQYQAMMQQWSNEERAHNGLGIMHQPQDPVQFSGLPHGSDASNTDQFQDFTWPQHPQQDVYDSPQDFNRRTLTQEAFDAISQHGGMMTSSGEFQTFDTGFSGDQATMNMVFPDFKHNVASFPYPVGAPLSSNDSTVPSNLSQQSFQMFPSSNVMQNHAAMSATSSDWADSRSSSLVSVAQYENTMQPSAHQQQPSGNSSRWEPGQSVPVDVNARREEFQQAAAQAQQAAAQAHQARASMEQNQMYEEPLAWPTDEAFMRRDSSASMLAHSMSNVGLATPQQHQHDVFKSPAPPANIAARRQRPRPAALGIASLRSQSFAGPVQPGSPGHVQQHHNMSGGQPIRRVMSHNVLNGGVAQGRIMKSMPGSAQRSPLNFTFNDAMNSPHLVRHVSQGNLAPPTPMSPSAPDQCRQPGPYQTVSSHVSRQPSISESDEYGLPYHPSASVPPPHVSPPHTPMWQQQPFIPQRIGSTVITENTPPQSAPAAQSCFPANIFTAPQQQVQQPPPLQTQAPVPQQMHAVAMPQQQPYMTSMVPEQQFQVPNVTFAPNQQANVVSSGPPPGAPIHFANGVPMVDADGNIQMAFPSHMQLMQQQQQSVPQQSHSPAPISYSFVTSAGASPGMQATAQPPKQSAPPVTDFVVHEYTPPDALKRSATPRKPVDTGPKNYTFSNAGPEQYEKARKGDSKDSTASTASTNSPASSVGAASTSTS